MTVPARLPSFPADFSILQLENLRVISAGIRGVSTLRAHFPELDQRECKPFSRFMHSNGNLDYNHGRKKIAYLYETAYRRLKERRFQSLAVTLAPQIAIVYNTGRSSFSDLGPLLQMAFGIDGAETRREAQTLPGAYAVYRRIDTPDGTPAVMRCARSFGPPPATTAAA